MNKPRLLYFILCVFHLVPFATGQELEERVEIEIVNIDLTATDSNGEFVKDLKPEDLLVTDEGVVRELTHFSSFLEPVDVPLSVALLIDVSRSMTLRTFTDSRFDIAKRAAQVVLHDLRPMDRIMIAAFDVRFLPVMDFTADKIEVEKAFAGLELLNYESAIYDSISQCAAAIRNESGRKIIIVFSDFIDTASRKFSYDAVKALNHDNITLLSFVIKDYRTGLVPGSPEDPNFSFGTIMRFSDEACPKGDTTSAREKSMVWAMRVRKLWDKHARETGGYAFHIPDPRDLTKALDKLREIIRSQYSIGFKPPENIERHTWRKIKITSNRKDVKLRYRKRYYVP